MSILKSTNSGKEHLRMYFSDFRERGYNLAKNNDDIFLYKGDENCRIDVKSERIENRETDLNGINYATVRFVINKAYITLVSPRRDRLYYFYINTKDDLDLVTEYFAALKEGRGFARLNWLLIDLAKEQWKEYCKLKFQDWK